ncbi:endo-1,4-beta-xylanase [Vibrio mangrovi]|uniref:Beta-xylanase n=1 Tax=Vibrio mangrovi TaxID=474394 RepID=A0A1Y6IWS2_9VIBR|nr:endo-1,4-beta-xylanase [Vibrio mangrovi]MDW6005454.1 endo-1,4-beta-xylanase [Vibrio mangrovi]SMS02104.1 Endo-1,4-beta-xylanase B precursor [Vibrio mangrovi]
MKKKTQRQWLGLKTKRALQCRTSGSVLTAFAVFSIPFMSAVAGTAGVSHQVDIASDWGVGYCANLTVTNNNGSAVNNWEVDVNIGGTVTSLWNAAWTQDGNIAHVSGSGQYTTLQAGQSTSQIGFCANRSADGGDDGSSGGDDGSSGSDPSDGGSSAGLAKNGDVENGLTNWSSTSGDVVRTTQDSHNGAASVLISNRTASWHGITFKPDPLSNGKKYNASVWVKLAPGTSDTTIILTGKRTDDADTSTTNEYVRIATVKATDYQWTELKGSYSQTGTPFQHFIIESDSSSVSYYADDFTLEEAGDADNSGGGSSDGGSSSGGKKFVGNITTSGQVRSDFSKYWNQITPENEGKWGSVERTRDVYNWSGVDAAYNYAKQHNIPFKQHTFVWGSQYPNWITSLSASEQAAEIEEWIHDFCSRYPDVDIIDVVNEATPGHAPAAFAKNAFGDDWVTQSFRLARKYCPNATLVLNDYNVLSWNTDEFIAMAKPAVQAGVVDAIGLQAHGLENFSTSRLKANLDKVIALGLPIYISEYDVAKTDDQAQLDVMKAQFPLFYNSDAVAGITLWGYVDGKTWRDGTGLIYDDGTQRPAMQWLMNYLGR